MYNDFTLLPDSISLQVTAGDGIFFESSGKWLHPLFDLEEKLAAADEPADGLILHDHIAGKAAAALMIRMGFRHCLIDTVSSHAVSLFRIHEIDFSYGNLVESISCKTEELLSGTDDIEEIYTLLKERRDKSGGTASK